MLKNGFIWSVGLTLALISGLVAVGAIAKNKAPELAATLQPLNGFAAESIASYSIREAVAKNKGQFPDSVDPAAMNQAKSAFLAEPATPEAIAVLALGEDRDTKRRLMQYAFTVSRREQIVTGWMIDDSGLRQDIPAILGYYDTMLRTNSSSASVIIPVLAQALADTNFIEPLADLLSTNPRWAGLFWAQVVSTPKAIGNAARLRERLYRENEASESYNDPGLVSALVRNKQFGTAEELYSLLSDKPSDASLIKNGSFQNEPKYPPLDWQLFSTGEYGASIIDGSLQFSAIQNSGGLFARQLVKLPPAVLQIDAIYDRKIPDDANIHLSISCAETIDNMPRAIRFSLTGKSTRQQIDNQLSGCRYYWFDMAGRASENGDGFDVGLKSISLQVK